MLITKFGHSCLLVEIKNARMLFDVGNYHEFTPITNVDVLLITHEHQDHVHVPSIKKLIDLNPEMRIVSHEGVVAILKNEGIVAGQISDGERIEIKGVSITSVGTMHACIHHDIPLVHNTGFLVDNVFFHPGDSFTLPKVRVAVLALPVAAPWLALKESVDYAKAVQPTCVIPIHDGMLHQDERLMSTRRIPTNLLSKEGIQFIDMRDGDSKEFAD
jgi:L-ascorbate metabolism protein UlaG (beta-lactamase superfamily)